MYQVDNKDRVVPLADVPQSSVGTPLPLVIADERRVVLAFYVQEIQPGWNGSSVRIVDPATSNQPLALVRFNGCQAHMFGPPNDEAFAGHPLSGRGLRPYSAFRVEDSSWIRRLERMNSVHPHHKPERFWKMQHIIFSFHDSTFECVCGGFDVRTERGSIHSAVPEMMKLLQ
jgi:hypothetical protein